MKVLILSVTIMVLSSVIIAQPETLSEYEKAQINLEKQKIEIQNKQFYVSIIPLHLQYFLLLWQYGV
jgi:hypothetical protein